MKNVKRAVLQIVNRRTNKYKKPNKILKRIYRSIHKLCYRNTCGGLSITTYIATHSIYR